MSGKDSVQYSASQWQLIATHWTRYQHPCELARTTFKQNI